MFILSFIHPGKYLDRILESFENPEPLTENNWIMTRKVVKGTLRISHMILKSRRCLVQSMIVKDVLDKKHIKSNLKIGARRDEEKKISTHAWIEIEGKTIIGGPISNFAPLIRTR